ncbi:hypothetical protein [uncultured Roseobacter sp.]|uniref:hypothetical protein n=1 Tax=uncultured Roseobacter sp. TaxID=114847 RepID=UPI002619F832|nr:hypothetical protein [uncultured Roseobacter sp.]
MRRFTVTAVIMVLASAATAQDWAIRDGDHPLDAREAATLTEGRTLTFYDDGRSAYSAGGAYSYTYASGQTAFGRYRIRADGTVCIDYRNGFARCDRYVENAGRIILLTEKGERFPVRPEQEK